MLENDNFTFKKVLLTSINPSEKDEFTRTKIQV